MCAHVLIACFQSAIIGVSKQIISTLKLLIIKILVTLLSRGDDFRADLLSDLGLLLGRLGFLLNRRSLVLLNRGSLGTGLFFLLMLMLILDLILEQITLPIGFEERVSLPLIKRVI